MSTTHAVARGGAVEAAARRRSLLERVIASIPRARADRGLHGGDVAVVPEIVARDTLLDILAAMMPLLVVAIGQTFVLIVAGIDLSAPADAGRARAWSAPR